jgi:hypothetical protein
MVLARRNTTVESFLREENVQDLFHLNIWLEAVKNTWVISEQFLTEATLYVDSVAKKSVIEEEARIEEEKSDEEAIEQEKSEEHEIVEKKPKRNKNSN